MDEEINIIDSNARNEKIKNFFINNKKILISFFVLIFITIIVYFAFNSYKNKKKIEISDLYNSTIIEYSEINKQKTINSLINLINKKDPTYSPLSLYFIIDYELITEQKKINKLFDIIIDEVSLEKEIKNLIIYKKALYNADKIDENEILKILNPLINSKSVWKGHALYLIAEFFYSKNEKQKSKEFFNQILVLENANQDLKIKAQKRLNRDLSE
jgi:predicted negative regulator of RcsB-dependent stress response|tara:strand:+ start:197 stop:841 length:645 start_codon:yes stop_codon:yes gene_type:complete